MIGTVGSGVGGAESSDDAALWNRGDRDSFGELFERHVEAVWNHAHHLTDSWEQAHEVTSATFLSAWRTRAEVTPVGDGALPLLYAMASEVARSHSPRGNPGLSAVGDHAGAVVLRIDGESPLREAIDTVRRLPQAQREVAELCLLGDLPVADAAVHLGVGEATVHSRLALARAGLAEDTSWRPAPCALPPELRGRLRAEFDHGVEHRSTRSFRVPAVVAVAAVLLAGTVFVLRQVPDPVEKTGVPSPVFDNAVATVALDRCWSAVQRQGVADRFPDRSRWKPVFTAGDAQIGVVAARADGKPLFCQTTPTTATVTDPTAAPDTGTAAVLFSREGVVAGVTDVDWDLIALKGRGPHGTVGVRAETADHMFVARTGVNLTGIALTISETGSENPTAVRTLTAPGPPVVVVGDQPDGPAPDRTSEVGKALGECLASASRPLPDPDSYQAGASVAYPGGMAVLGRNSGSLVTCRSDGRKTEAVRSRLVNSSAPAVLRFADPTGAGDVLIGGELTPEVAAVEIGVNDEPLRPAAVAGRTFVFVAPPIVRVDPTTFRAIRAVALDANGDVLFENFWRN